MVSPLVPILANLFMSHLETTWLELETTRFQNVCSMDHMSMTNFVFWRLLLCCLKMTNNDDNDDDDGT